MEDIRKYDETDVMRLRDELVYLYGKRRAFLGIGLGLMGTAILSFITMAFLPIAGLSGVMPALIILTILGTFMFVAGIIILILRSALFNTRINNRRLLLRQYEYFKKKDLNK